MSEIVPPTYDKDRGPSEPFPRRSTEPSVYPESSRTDADESGTGNTASESFRDRVNPDNVITTDGRSTAEDPRDTELRELRAQLAGQKVDPQVDSEEEWTPPEPPPGWERNDDGSVTAVTVPWPGYGFS